MDGKSPSAESFRGRFTAGERLVGSFVKTPSVHATEIFGLLGYDFIVIDEEHAPIDRAMTDIILLAARAYGMAGLVRVSSDDPSKLLSALDCGAAGVLVPHVDSVAKAKAVAASGRYRGGRRAIRVRPGRAPIQARPCGTWSRSRIVPSRSSR